ncbi:hypothetical protein SAMN05421771_2298 [Granulicella pectinivorans]|uniref:Outer membrane protein beta-barrel domain-containing protein n=1 Tax=Granulicella pectinivorans TaxID=474950 RepID=A0A1I6MCJ7_9BACT|nr:hypothetical protein [Granulicella pectinivorans]SFS13415.1 hypothetical protein SAMN05421771_2298 [Granulicella pectinivorans]
MIRQSVVLLAASLFAVSAHAQLAGYATLTVSRMSNLQSSPYAAPLAPNPIDNSFNPLGGTFGAYYDFKTLGPVRLGVDARTMLLTTKQGAESGYNGVGGKVYSYLGGVRGTFHTPLKAFEGYVQGSAGLGQSNYGFPPAAIAAVTKETNTPASRIIYKNNFEYHAFVGLQLHVTPIAEWRVFEVGYGALSGGGHTYPLQSVSTGVVFHFPVAQ